MTTAGSLAKRGEKNPMFGKRAATYKGGKVRYGYKMVYEPTHPLAQKNGYIYEHRLVIMNHLKRLLKIDEIVHHINGNKLDNKIENLTVTKRDKHTKHHVKGVIRSIETRKKISITRKKLGFKPTKPFLKGQSAWNKGLHTSTDRIRDGKGRFI